MTEEEARDDWRKMFDNPNAYDRDWTGRQGNMRIWCPSKHVRLVDFGRLEEQGVTMKTKDKRNPKDKDLDEFRAALPRQGFTNAGADHWKPFGGSSGSQQSSGFIDGTGSTAHGAWSLGEQESQATEEDMMNIVKQAKSSKRNPCF